MAESPMTPVRVIHVPTPSLVVLVGATGSGKSTFAATHFKPTEILSSDHYRGVVADDENDQVASAPAFEALHAIAGIRLRLGRLTVVDATNVKPQDRAGLVKIAREHDLLPVAIVLDLDEKLCAARNATRPDRQLPPHVVGNHVRTLRRGLRGLSREGFRQVAVLRTPEEVAAVQVMRDPLLTDLRTETGPFDIIGDVHGCYDELCDLLTSLGYATDDEAGRRHLDGRRVIFLGDLVDRGPDSVAVLDLAREMRDAGTALCVPGNHDDKLRRYLDRARVVPAHGLEETVAQIEAIPEAERGPWSKVTRDFIESLVSHYVLDGGKLVVAHAGMKKAYQGRASGRVRAFALYGDTTGEVDEMGLPVRLDWAADYRGTASVVYGHTPVREATWLNNTINIDTGCVFGGKLTALRWPERELISVPARVTYAESRRASFVTDDVSDTLLRIEDVQGKQVIQTGLMSNVVIEADNVAAALEVMSRFALDPRWLIYLPPTMSPSETSAEPGWLEYPTEAFAYFRQQGLSEVICEEKHMGSRAVLILCRDSEVATRRFGVGSGSLPGACYTRTGRRFFDDDALDRALITRLGDALTRAGYWERFETDWICLDAELMPWSAKAQGLLQRQYAPVATAGSAALEAAYAAVEAAMARGVDLGSLAGRISRHQEAIARYAEAYGRYCWDVSGLDELRIAPFHLLATEGRTYHDHSHLWHLRELSQLVEADSIFVATTYHVVDLKDAASYAAAVVWWETLTERGGEGMVVKPLDWVVRGKRGMVQPAVKCRGREYLRIIYGPTYTEPEHLAQLRKRGLGVKRSLALREYALGIEALERFVRREPLWRVHQPVFGVLALESEPVDPRL